MPKVYRVIYTPDPDGKRWNAEILGKPGRCVCVTWGRSLREARAHIREALAVALEDDAAPTRAEFREVFKLREARSLQTLRTKRGKIDDTVRALASEPAEVARRLHKRGLSMRDIAELVGASHQRVQQWVAAGRKRAV